LRRPLLGLSIAALARRPRGGGAAPPPVTAFGPLDLGGALAAWWDADDAASFTLASGVSQWSDKSGKARHLVQAATANRPQRNEAVLAGRAGVQFSGSFLTCAAAAAPVSATAFTLFVVTSNDVVSASNRGVMSLYPAGGTNDWNAANAIVMMEQMTSGIVQSYANNAVGAQSPVGGAAAAAKLLSSEVDATAATAMRLNGALTPNAGSTRTGLTLSAAVNILVGSRLVGGIAVASYGLNAVLHEIILVDGAPAAADRQKIEGFLAAKWGLQALLPAGHPYKSGAP